VRKAQYFRNKNFLLENRFGTALQQVPDWSAAHVPGMPRNSLSMLFYAQKMPKKDLFAHASQYCTVRV
jgi:hypothetical protein